MKITGIQLSEEDMCKAAQEYLKRFGLNVKVESIARKYQYSGDWDVNIEDPQEAKPEPIPVVKEDLVKAILEPEPSLTEVLKGVAQPSSSFPASKDCPF